MAIVFGGSGFIGSHICRHLVASGKKVRSISRRGRPLWMKDSLDWTRGVEWSEGDMFHPSAWEGYLEEANHVIISIGAFGSNEFMERICGDGPLSILETTHKRTPSSIVTFVSAQKASGTPDFFLSGYFRGKTKMESRMKELFPSSHLILQPGFVFGEKHVGNSGGVLLPLQFVGLPLRAVTLHLPQILESIPLVGQGLIPPTDVNDISLVIASADAESFQSRTLTSRAIYQEGSSLRIQKRCT
jgi:hypothetical protein